MTKLAKVTITITPVNIEEVRKTNLIKHSCNCIIDEFREEFSKALYADFEDRDKYVAKLVRGIVQKFHLY